MLGMWEGAPEQAQRAGTSVPNPQATPASAGDVSLMVSQALGVQ